MQYLCIFYLSLVVEGGSSLMDEAVVAQEDRFNNISWLDVPFRAYSFGLQKISYYRVSHILCPIGSYKLTQLIGQGLQDTLQINHFR